MPPRLSLQSFAAVIALVVLATAPACAKRRPYVLGSASQYNESPQLARMTNPQIERGERRPLLDGLGWVIGIPGKIVLWDRRIDNHNVSYQTEASVGEYLAANELSSVKVRINQYAPLEEWRRLRSNKAVGWGWRYTFGTFAWLGDTIFPGRVWGGDHYNAYTNTIYVYSDISAVALHEAGHAKDFARRDWPGTYAALYTLPVVPLWHEAVATSDALDYIREFGSADDEREAYKLLYPAYGTYIGGAVGDWVPGYGWATYAAAVVGGHAAGRWEASRVEDRAPRALARRDWTDISTTLPSSTFNGNERLANRIEAQADHLPEPLEAADFTPFETQAEQPADPQDSLQLR
ncbi:MAG: hypothetical protein QM775_16110 [Pirellulales bacterium]